MRPTEVENKILRIIEETNSLIPTGLIENLEINQLSKQPEWHSFENQIWKNGEEIRHLIITDKTLKSKENIFNEILKIATNRNAKRGRQSFILLLGSVKFSKHSQDLISQLEDEFVNGHIIDTIYKMRVDNYVEEILPFCNHKMTWIKETARKYVEKYGTKQANLNANAYPDL